MIRKRYVAEGVGTITRSCVHSFDCEVFLSLRESCVSISSGLGPKLELKRLHRGRDSSREILPSLVQKNNFKRQKSTDRVVDRTSVLLQKIS